MSAPLPSTLTRGYWTRANVPFGTDNTSMVVLNTRALWNLVHLLTNQLTTGTASGSRASGSVWIVRGSSDGVGGFSALTSPGVAGTNLWWNAGVFPTGGLKWAANGTNHNWIVLENVALGRELIINCTQNADGGYANIGSAPSGSYSGGSATTCPNASSGATSIQQHMAAWNGTDGGQSVWWYDGVYGATYYSHITVADTGEFWFANSRTGSGIFNSFVSLWKTTDGHVSDTLHNAFLMVGNYDISGRGACKVGQYASWAWVSSRQPSGVLKNPNGGGLAFQYAGGINTVPERGTDGLSGLIPAEKAEIVEGSPGYFRRGFLTDWYVCGAETVGAAVPASGATQLRAVIGDLLLPCVGVTPII